MRWLNRCAYVALLACSGMTAAAQAQTPFGTSSALDDWPATPRANQAGGTVSVELLRHPIPEKARAMFRKALHASDAGNHESAIQQLKAALAKYPSSAAQAHSVLGAEYLRAEQYQAAANSLEHATALLPHDATNHSNFGLALLALKQFDRAEAELRRALELDVNMVKTRELLSALVSAKSTLVSEQR